MIIFNAEVYLSPPKKYMLIEEPIFHKDFETTFLTIVKLPNELKALVLPAKNTNSNTNFLESHEMFYTSPMVISLKPCMTMN